MGPIILKILIAVLVFAVAGFSRPLIHRKSQRRHQGSTTVLPITLKAIEAYKKIAPGVGISVTEAVPVTA